MQIPSFMCSGTMAIELRELNDKKKKKKKKKKKQPKSGKCNETFGTQTCSVL